jgi:hypothetical protein
VRILVARLPRSPNTSRLASIGAVSGSSNAVAAAALSFRIDTGGLPSIASNTSDAV